MFKQIEERSAAKTATRLSLDAKAADVARLEGDLQQLESHRQDALLFNAHTDALNGSLLACC